MVGFVINLSGFYGKEYNYIKINLKINKYEKTVVCFGYLRHASAII